MGYAGNIMGKCAEEMVGALEFTFSVFLEQHSEATSIAIIFQCVGSVRS